MHLEININNLPCLKSDLRKYHPEAKASQRIEAAARGLGFKSYAAMRTALNAAPQIVEPNDIIFGDYLNIQVKDKKQFRDLSRALVRILAQNILKVEQSITERGFDSLRPRTREEREMSYEQRKAAFEERRKEALGDWAMDQLELALIYLDMQKRRKTINRNFSSYSLKHRAENLSREQKIFTHLGDYVSNGMFIVAALICKFDCKQISPRSQNAFFNISSKTIRSTANRPVMTISEKDQMMAYALASSPH